MPLRPFHSVVIPHRDRTAHLRLCLRFLAAAHQRLNFQRAVEVVIVDACSRQSVAGVLAEVRDHESGPHFVVRLVIDGQRTGDLFAKNRALNAGLRHARGALVTFLDCDMLAGPDFWSAGPAYLTDRAALTRLCYRSRQVPGEIAVLAGIDDEKIVRWAGNAWDDYAEYPARPEFAGDPMIAFRPGGWLEERHGLVVPRPPGPYFGNSQWTARRIDLEGFELDEGYVGAGHEDLDSIRAFYRKMGDRYQATLPQRPRQNLFHLVHPRDDRRWRTPETVKAGAERYWRKDKAHSELSPFGRIQ